MRSRVPLIVFDLDGTLVDSRRDLADSANELLQGYGAAPLEVAAVVSMVGEGARVLVERVLAAAHLTSDEAALPRFLDIYERRVAVQTRTYPGVGETLSVLGGRMTLALLTNKPGRHTRLLLDALRLAPFFEDRVIGGDGPEPRKPDPAGLRHLMQAAGVTADATLMVGDSVVDLDTARRAGVRACLVGYGFGDVPASAMAADVLRAPNPADLLPTIAAFASGIPGGSREPT